MDDAYSFLEFIKANPTASLGDLDVTIAKTELGNARDLLDLIKEQGKKNKSEMSKRNGIEGARNANSYTEWMTRKKAKPVTDFASSYIEPVRSRVGGTLIKGRRK